MARKPRIHLSGGLYHVILRGNAGQPVFLADLDHYRFFLLLQEGTCRFGYRVHAFCCMTNHIHLVLQAGDIPLSRGMQNLSFRYTRWINWREQRTGRLGVREAWGQACIRAISLACGHGLGKWWQQGLGADGAGSG